MTRAGESSGTRDQEQGGAATQTPFRDTFLSGETMRQSHELAMFQAETGGLPWKQVTFPQQHDSTTRNAVQLRRTLWVDWVLRD